MTNLENDIAQKTPQSSTPPPDPILLSRLEAVADNTRLRILMALRQGHEACKGIDGYVGIHVSDLAKHVDMTQPAVSQHLARLRQAGLVTVTRKGQFAYYMREDAALESLRQAMALI